MSTVAEANATRIYLQPPYPEPPSVDAIVDSGEWQKEWRRVYEERKSLEPHQRVFNAPLVVESISLNGDAERSECGTGALAFIAEAIELRIHDPLMDSIGAVRVGDLDRILEGDPDTRPGYLGFGICDNLLQHLDWWQEVAFEGIGCHEAYLFDLCELVLRAWPAARRSSCRCGSDCGETVTELLRCYRLFTKEVCLIAQGMYPSVDMTPLLELA